MPVTECDTEITSYSIGSALDLVCKRYSPCRERCRYADAWPRWQFIYHIKMLMIFILPTLYDLLTFNVQWPAELSLHSVNPLCSAFEPFCMMFQICLQYDCDQW